MNTTQAIAQILKTEGVKWIGCFPSNDLIEEVAKVGIRPIMFRHERGALMAASGYSLLEIPSPSSTSAAGPDSPAAWFGPTFPPR